MIFYYNIQGNTFFTAFDLKIAMDINKYVLHQLKGVNFVHKSSAGPVF